MTNICIHIISFPNTDSASYMYVYVHCQFYPVFPTHSLFADLSIFMSSVWLRTPSMQLSLLDYRCEWYQYHNACLVSMVCAMLLFSYNATCKSPYTHTCTCTCVHVYGMGHGIECVCDNIDMIFVVCRLRISLSTWSDWVRRLFLMELNSLLRLISTYNKYVYNMGACGLGVSLGHRLDLWLIVH